MQRGDKMNDENIENTSNEDLINRIMELIQDKNDEEKRDILKKIKNMFLDENK